MIMSKGNKNLVHEYETGNFSKVVIMILEW